MGKNAKLCAERHLSECQEHKKASTHTQTKNQPTERTIMYNNKNNKKRTNEGNGQKM